MDPDTRDDKFYLMGDLVIPTKEGVAKQKTKRRERNERKEKIIKKNEQRYKPCFRFFLAKLCDLCG